MDKNGEWHDEGARNPETGKVWHIGYWWDELSWKQYESGHEDGLDARGPAPEGQLSCNCWVCRVTDRDGGAGCEGQGNNWYEGWSGGSEACSAKENWLMRYLGMKVNRKVIKAA